MKTSFIKFTLGWVALLAFSFGPAQAVMINQLTDQEPASETNQIMPNSSYNSWVLPPTEGSNVWNSWGLGVSGTATSSGGLVFNTKGSGGAFSLDLSSYDTITIDAKGLEGNEVTAFNLIFFSEGGTTKGTLLSFTLPSASHPGSTLSVNRSAGTLPWGVTELANWSAITEYQIQGNFNAPTAFAMQYTNLQAVPESGTWVLLGIAGTVLMLMRRSRSGRES
jgi:hypothetical protein